MKMNKERAEDLLRPLRKGTAKGISPEWQARIIEALEYVVEYETIMRDMTKEKVWKVRLPNADDRTFRRR